MSSGKVDIDDVLVAKFKTLHNTFKPIKQLELLNEIEVICYLDTKKSRDIADDQTTKLMEEEFRSLSLYSSPVQQLQQGAAQSFGTMSPSTPTAESNNVLQLMNVTESSISFGEQSFLLELFMCINTIESRVVLRRIASFWAKYFYYYHDYLIVLLSNHVLLAGYFESIRQLLQRPHIVPTLQLLCEPFVHFPTGGPIDLVHFLENSAVFNPMIIPRTTTNEQPQITSPPPQLHRQSTFSTLFSRTSTASSLSQTSIPSVVSPRASMSNVFKEGIAPGQKLNIFTLIGYPPVFEEDISDYPSKVSILFNAFPIPITHDTIMKLFDDFVTFFEQFDILVPPETLSTLPSTLSSVPKTKPEPKSPQPITPSKPTWIDRKNAPEHGLSSLKEIAICKYVPPETFHSDSKQPAIDAFDIITKILTQFITQEDARFNIGWEKPTHDELIQKSQKYTAKTQPLSILNLINETYDHRFFNIVSQIYFHPRARFVSEKFIQTLLTYANFAQLLKLIEMGFFTSYYPGPEYGIAILCRDIYTVVHDNYTINAVDRENFIIALFQLSSTFQLIWLYIMYASTIELLSTDERVKYATRNDYYWLSRMFIQSFEILSASPEQAYLFMQYFASIAMYRFTKWVDLLIAAETKTHVRQFFKNSTNTTIGVRNYALKANSMICFMTYLYDWLFTFSTLGTYNSIENQYENGIQVEQTLLTDAYKSYYLQYSNRPNNNPGQFLTFFTKLDGMKVHRRWEQDEIDKNNVQDTELRTKLLSITIDSEENTPEINESRTIIKLDDDYIIGLEQIYSQSELNAAIYKDLIHSRSWTPIDFAAFPKLHEKQRINITSWASKMLRNATLSSEKELSNSIFKLFQFSNDAYKQISEYNGGDFPNPIQRWVPLSHFPSLSDEQLSHVLENFMKVYIGGLLLGSDELKQ